MAMKVTNWTQGMIELQEYVVGDCYCLLDLFLENVENEGWTLAASGGWRRKSVRACNVRLHRKD